MSEKEKERKHIGRGRKEYEFKGGEKGMKGKERTTSRSRKDGVEDDDDGKMKQASSLDLVNVMRRLRQVHGPRGSLMVK